MNKTQTDLEPDFEKYVKMCEDLRENFLKRFQDPKQTVFLKMANNLFFCQHHQKKPKTCQTLTHMPNSIFSSQTTFK